MAWFYLILAGIEEVVAVFAMKHLDGFKKKWPIILMTVGFIFSFYCLTMAMQAIPPGVAYAVWAGIGTVGITLVSLFWFKEEYRLTQFIFLGLIVIGVMGMRVTT
ncbi:DMT family transporter [Kroppenstedtia eburnea]|uniref:Quaternary ammonium compound-resistance protein SugE n=1 Tax=Kroppenstedtia eburnea TaxID=714067 RepID=A0A1N7LDZ1_9BACL|nr:multidrug efflux SMR transporter [Kroppenstedtia eburnea]EGK07641.1 quaternary ammonium compound-resistance protein SugE [Desmospora sp. 8437]QKI81393.1 multidrug efflux SMR transporter [Kroppenstedtia eburnea]SIS71997.1 quaternary ammonium compound-resistance protein SugE [Kroppenstedtia eburnea]